MTTAMLDRPYQLLLEECTACVCRQEDLVRARVYNWEIVWVRFGVDLEGDKVSQASHR